MRLKRGKNVSFLKQKVASSSQMPHVDTHMRLQPIKDRQELFQSIALSRTKQRVCYTFQKIIPNIKCQLNPTAEHITPNRILQKETHLDAEHRHVQAELFIVLYFEIFWCF